MNNLQISIIIPTFNRWDTLLQCISALKEQTLDPSSYEVIVVDDGSTDKAYKTFISRQGTKNNEDNPLLPPLDKGGMGGFLNEGINNLKEINFPNLRYFHQNKRGPASARNLGIRNARGEILLFIGDDIIASDNLLEEHLIFHKKIFQEENSACLGYITWPVNFKPSPFLDFMGNWGQFLFGNLLHGEELNYNHFYSSNISLKKHFLLNKNIFFDENFKYAAWEDIEFGYRLEKEGLRIFFNRNAVVFHNHYQTIESAINRSKISGEALYLLLKKLPELSENFGFLKTKKGFIPRHRFIKNIIRNKLSVAAMAGLLKLFNPDNFYMHTEKIQGLQDKNVLPIDRQSSRSADPSTGSGWSPEVAEKYQHGEFVEPSQQRLTLQNRLLETRKKPNRLLKEIYKNILLYHLQKNFEKAQKNCQE